MPGLGISYALPFKSGVLAWSPAKLDTLQWLFDSTLLDKSGNELDADLVESPCLTFGLGDAVTLDNSFSGSIWSVGFSTKDAVLERVHVFVIGGESTRNIGLRTSSANVPFYRDVNSTYLKWDGTGNTTAVDTTTDQEYVFTSNGTNVYLYVNGVSKGYVTPITDSILIFRRYGAGYSSISVLPYEGGLFNVSASAQFSADGNMDVLTKIFHHPIIESSGSTVRDVSLTNGIPNHNNGEITSVSGLDTMWNSVTQDETHPFATDGGSKVLAEDGTTEIAVTGLTGTETITSVGTATVTASAGKLTVSGGYVSTISIDGTLTYELRKFYGTAIPSSSVWPDGVLTGGEELYHPALADGTDDVAGLGITNPGGLLHNNGPHKTLEPVTSTALLWNRYLSTDGIVFVALSYEDYTLIQNFNNQTILKWTDDCFVEQRVIMEEDYTWTPSDYTNMGNWAGTPCYADALVPAEVTAGTGIGPDLDWADAGDGTLLFVTP